MRKDIVLAAANLGFEFMYARKDFQNLLRDAILDTTYLIIDPIKTSPKYSNVTGARTGVDYSGHFLLLRKSQLNEQYYEKVVKYIEPLEVDLENLRLALINCNNEYQVEWSYDEIVNKFNINMDGLIVRYTIKIDV